MKDWTSTRRCTNGTTGASCWPSSCTRPTQLRGGKGAPVFSEQYLLQRPLLKAIRRPQPPVLLIDEVDRADEEFEAYLLEVLSDYQISIPELGTIAATSIPHVLLTSNGTRELSDACAGAACTTTWTIRTTTRSCASC
jgi:MoxR-like ATPase